MADPEPRSKRMMRVYDISRTIAPRMAVYKDKEAKRPRLEQTRTLNEGARESRICIDSQSGTHVDAPSHMLEEGAAINALPAEHFVKPCIVILINAEVITREVLAAYDIPKGHFILLRTKNSDADEEAPFDPTFAYLDEGGAEYLVERGVAGVGTDGLGIEREQPEHRTHTQLMHAGIAIIEGLRLAHVEPGRYLLVAPPISIENVDGAPTRALLLDGLEVDR